MARRALQALMVATCSACLAPGCSAPHAGAGQPQSAASQSIAEYDIARDTWLARGQTREALEHVLRAIELDEENAEAQHLAALIYLDFCQRGGADCRQPEVERHARRALEANPEFLEARNTLGVSLIHQGRPEEAALVLRPLTENILYKTPENAWGNLGWAYLEQGQLEAAVAALKRSIAAQPDFCVGHYRLGLAYEKLGKAEQSIAAFTQALESAGGRCQGLQAAYAGRARMLSHLDRMEAARTDLETCVRLDKHTPAGRECSDLQRRAFSSREPTPQAP